MSNPLSPPTDSLVAQRSDVERWQPYVRAALHQQGLAEPAGVMRAGFNPTHPTFVWGEWVIKLLGGSPFWRRSHRAELDAHRRLAYDPGIAAPRLVARGQLFPEIEQQWPYLISTRIEGAGMHCAALSREDRAALAQELGGLLRRVHQLPRDGGVTAADWDPPTPIAALQRSRFPSGLLDQVEAFLATLPPSEPVFVHGDVVDNHVFVRDGRLAGLIDWGDALVADRHYEVGKLHLHTFGGDKILLRAFLEGYGWEPSPDFARLTLAHAIHRQAIGLAQHRAFDLFHRLDELVSVDSIATLDDLAQLLFQPQ